MQIADENYTYIIYINDFTRMSRVFGVGEGIWHYPHPSTAVLSFQSIGNIAVDVSPRAPIPPQAG
jgi:hypothetical protein